MSFYTLKLNFLFILMVLMVLSSGYGYQCQALLNQKSPPYNITVGRNIKLLNPESVGRVTDKKQQNKQQTQLDVTKHAKRKHKSAVSIDNSKKSELSFGWPIKGRVLKSFSPSHNKGIDIAGKKGRLVKATEAGKVVYGGQGLIGFGKLLIIRHNDVYLSAYANNSRLLVNEGQDVQKGQIIAEVGDVGIKRTSLHFEIRKNGKPVNPLKLLP
jgi:lipoprotein NlpD